MEKPFEPIRAPARVLQVIHEIANSTCGLNLATLVKLTGLPKTSLLSLLRSLEASNYVINVSGSYRLGQETLSVARAITASDRLLPNIRAAMHSLHVSTGETILFSVLAADAPEAESIEVIETRKPIRLSFPVGVRRPLHASSIGKLLLAYQAAEWIKAHVSSNNLAPYTSHTITSRDELLSELDHIRTTGISVSHQGMFEDASGISVAVWNGNNEVIGGLSLIAPTYRLEPKQCEFSELLFSAGKSLSRDCGFAGPYPPSSR
jgi:IclR family acetate operon transcriptional repressor